MLQPTKISQPDKTVWIEISERFYSKTNFPNYLESVDGKHHTHIIYMHIKCTNPDNSSSLFYNFKKYFSIVPTYRSH